MEGKTKLIWSLVALICAAAIFAGIYFVARPGPDGGLKQISVEVVHKDETSKTFTYETDAEYLGDVLLEEGLVQGDGGEFGLYITVVDGEQALYQEDGAYWAFYEGDEYAAQGADLTPISDGDNFKLVYTYG